MNRKEEKIFVGVGGYLTGNGLFNEDGTVIVEFFDDMHDFKNEFSPLPRKMPQFDPPPPFQPVSNVDQT